MLPKPIQLREQALVSVAKEASKKLHDGTITLDQFKKTQDYLKLPQDLRDPLLAEIGRQSYLTYGTKLNTEAPWGVSIKELLQADKLPKPKVLGDYIELDLSNLRINDLDGLQQVPNIENLVKLDLKDNKISAIGPNAFARLKNLETLHLNDNKINAIGPKAFAGLDNLEILTLDDNQISAIDGGAFNNLNKLEALGLNNNQISTLKRDIFAGPNNLREGIYIWNNPLTKESKKTLREQFGNRVTFTD